MTGAGPNDHHWLLDDVPRGALELHLDGFGVVRGAAPAIAADSTVPGLVGMQACAVLELQVDGFEGLRGAQTLFSFLRKKQGSDAQMVTLPPRTILGVWINLLVACPISIALYFFLTGH